MSLDLERERTDKGVSISTNVLSTREVEVYFAGKSICMADFCDAVMYVLTNHNLVPGDPRLSLAEKIRSMHTVPAEGFFGVGKKLEEVPFDITSEVVEHLKRLTK